MYSLFSGRGVMQKGRWTCGRFWRWPRPGAMFLSNLHGNLCCSATPQDSPIQTTSSGGVTKQDSAGSTREIAFHRIHTAHHLCLCWSFCFTVIFMWGLVWAGVFSSSHPKIQLSQLMHRGDLNFLGCRSAANLDEWIYHWFVSYPWMITITRL